MQDVNNYILSNSFEPTISPSTTSATRSHRIHQDFTFTLTNDSHSSNANVISSNPNHPGKRMLITPSKKQLVSRPVRPKKRISASSIVDGVRQEVAALQDELNRLQNAHHKRQLIRSNKKINQRWQIALSIIKKHSVRACRENENLMVAHEEYKQIIGEMKKCVQRCVRMESPTKDIILQDSQVSGFSWTELRNSVQTQLLKSRQILSEFDVSNMKELTPIIRTKKALKVSCERRQSVIAPFAMEEVASAAWKACEKNCSSFVRQKIPDITDGEILEQGNLRLEMRRVQVAVPCRIVKMCREVDGNICICGVVVGRVPSSLVSMHQTPEDSSAYIELHARVWFIYRKIDQRLGNQLGNARNEPMCQQIQFSTIQLHSDGEMSYDGNVSIDSESSSRMKIFRRVGVLADLFRHFHDSDMETCIQNTENYLMDSAIRN